MNYGFKCPEQGCLNRAQFYIMLPMNLRPQCPRHHVHYVPAINWPPGVKIEEATITPPEARDLIQDAHLSSLENIDYALVDKYAELMKSGEWVFITKEMGGEHYPIYMRDDRVLLGIQRLMACNQSDTPFDTVVVRTYGYY